MPSVVPATGQDTLAVFGGHVSSVFKTLKRNLGEQAEVVSPYVQMCSDALKACYPYEAEFDLLEALNHDDLNDELQENPEVALPLLTIGHLTNYMLHCKKAHKTPAESAEEFSAAFGDRNGMISAIAVSSSKTDEDFNKNTINAIKAAVIAGGKDAAGAELVQQWASKGITFPTCKSMSLPVLGPDGAGDLSKDDKLAETLAAILCKTQKQVDKEVLKEAQKNAKSVVDFGVPAAQYGKIALPIDGIRDMAVLEEALPDVGEIKKAIHNAGYSTDVNLALSFGWLFHDIVVAAAVLYGMSLLYPIVCQNFWVKWFAVWPIWSLFFGTIIVGVWVIGHECGHRAFAGTGQYALLNDFVGFFCHTSLLVPFWAWRFSHHKHHMFTNHLLDGETHVPAHKNVAIAEKKLLDVMGEDAFVLWNIVRHLLFGWPLYLISNFTGGRRTPGGKKIDRNKPLSHFRPESQIFEENQRSMILPGTIGIFAVFALLGYMDYTYGLGTTLFWYWGPYLVVNCWLVGYTWMHHADVEVPHFSDGYFSYMRGATCSIDRAYPWWINYLHHHIGSTHVMHHISFQVPHYRAVDATKVYREKYPHLYRFDTRPILQSLWETAKNCHYVESINGVQYYKATQNLPSKEKSS